MPINTQRDIEEYLLECEKRYGYGWDPKDDKRWIDRFESEYGYDPMNQYVSKEVYSISDISDPGSFRDTTPTMGHLVRFPKVVDHIPMGTTGIIVDTRGIEIQVMMPDNNMVWIRRDLVEVVE
jgi:hypothetical protein